MSQLRLYKKFYCVSTISGDYTLINPYSLTASTFVASNTDIESNTLIQSNINFTQESTGIYYVDLDQNFYASDITYDLVWFVKYIDIAPVKKISSRFRMLLNGVTNNLEIELVNNVLEIEISENELDIDISQNMQIDISNQSLNLDISGNNTEIEIL